MFLKNVQEKGMEGGVSQRALRSTFASDLPISVINEITSRRKNKPGRQYSNLPVFQAKNSLNDGASTSSSSNLSLFQVKNAFNDGVSTNYSSNLSVFQAKNSFNDGASTNYPSYGGRKGMMASSSSSSSFLTRNFKFDDTSNQNHTIIGNDSFNHYNYGAKNWNFGSTSKPNNWPKTVTFSPIHNDPLRVHSEVGIETTNKGGFDKASANSFGFNFTGQNENINFRSCLNERFGLVHGGFGLVNGGVSGVNVSGTRGNHLHKLKAVVENEKHYNKADFNQMEFNISDSLVADGMNLHNEVCKH